MAFEIDFLPVGSEKKSGDCIVIRYGDLVNGGSKQTLIVVDGGYKDTWSNKLKPHLQQYFNCMVNGKIQIDLVVLSHTDQDHVGGLVEMAKDDNVKIGSIMMHCPWSELSPKWFKDGRITKESLKEHIGDAFESAKELDDIAKYKIKKMCLIPDKYDINDAKITILGPDSCFYKECIASCEKTPDTNENVSKLPQSKSSNGTLEFEPYVKGQIKWDDTENTSPVNESSLILLIEYDGVKVLLTGDAGKKGMRRAIHFAAEHSIPLNDCTIIKMPHHGSRKNVDPNIMSTFVGSGMLIYSCASEDLGHHPSMRLINMLNEEGFKEQFSTSGSILNWGKDAPPRHWLPAISYPVNKKIEK